MEILRCKAEFPRLVLPQQRRPRQQLLKWWVVANMDKLLIFFSLLILTLFLLGCSTQSSLAGEKVTVLKSGGCGCCGVFGNYLEQKGFDVEINDVSDSTSIKSQYKIPTSMESCHTTIIGNYFVEGH